MVVSMDFLIKVPFIDSYGSFVKQESIMIRVNLIRKIFRLKHKMEDLHREEPDVQVRFIYEDDPKKNIIMTPEEFFFEEPLSNIKSRNINYQELMV